MADHNILGKKGEELALRYLKDNGYKILETNWRFKHKEVDIIAREGNEICFIEVKTRSSDKWGSPEESVTVKKRKLLINAARAYVENMDCMCEVRFDVIAVITDGEQHTIKHIRQAFIAGIDG